MLLHLVLTIYALVVAAVVMVVGKVFWQMEEVERLGVWWDGNKKNDKKACSNWTQKTFELNKILYPKLLCDT